MPYIKREWTQKFLPIAVVLAAAACDSAAPPEDAWENFDPQAVMAAAEEVVAPAAASEEANIALHDAAGDLILMGVEFAPEAEIRPLRQPQAAVFAPTVAYRTMLTIPAELQGRTFVYDPAAGGWEVDDARTGAPANGVRIVYYATTATGDYALPLSERGYIDLTDEDTSTQSRVGVHIVRTTGGTDLTLADYIQGYSETETAAGWVSRVQAEGLFSDGTDQVNFTFAAVDSLDNATEESAWTFGMSFEGENADYEWRAEGVDQISGAYDEQYRISLARQGEVTGLELDFSGTSTTDDASGILSHRGITLANIALSEAGDSFVFTKPGGDSFTQSEQQTLESLLFTLIFAGFNILSYLPLLFV